jgi:hypothetical protein
MKYFLRDDNKAVIKAEQYTSPFFERWDYRNDRWVEDTMAPDSSTWMTYYEVPEKKALYWLEWNKQRMASMKR